LDLILSHFLEQAENILSSGSVFVTKKRLLLQFFLVGIAPDTSLMSLGLLLNSFIVQSILPHVIILIVETSNMVMDDWVFPWLLKHVT
jgi:hypothetical protein